MEVPMRSLAVWVSRSAYLFLKEHDRELYQSLVSGGRLVADVLTASLLLSCPPSQALVRERPGIPLSELELPEGETKSPPVN